MRKIAITIFVLGLFGCDVLDVAVDVKYKTLSNVFLKNNVELQYSKNYFVTKNKNEFLKYFGVGRTMAPIAEIDYNKTILGIAVPPANKQTKIKVVSVKKSDENLIVNYQINYGKELSYNTQPVVIFQAELMGAKNVIFTTDNIYCDTLNLSNGVVISGRCK